MRNWRSLAVGFSAGLIFCGLILFLPHLVISIELSEADINRMDPAQLAGSLNDIRSSVLTALGGSVLLGSAYIAWRQYQHTVQDAREQRKAEQQDQLAALFGQAVEQVSADQLPKRLGGIHTLGRIAAQSKPYQNSVVDVLAGFVRMTVPLGTHLTAGMGVTSVPNDGLPLRVRSVDAQAALTVLGQWGPSAEKGGEWPTADLTSCDLRLANLQGAHLWRVRLYESDLTDANLRGADLRGADLRGCILLGADLAGATCDQDTWWPDGYDWEAAVVK